MQRKTVAHFFSWSKNETVSDFVWEHYSRLGPTHLSTKIKEEFGVYIHPENVRKHMRDRRQKAGEGPPKALDLVPVPDPAGRFPDTKEPMTDQQVEEMYRLAMTEAERREATFSGKTSHTVNFRTENLPIGICYWSDWQLGSNGVLMRKLWEDAETIRDTDGLYTFPLGDLVQNLNVRKHPQGMADCVLAGPRDQFRLAKHLLKMTKSKILGCVTGNHEENSKVAAGLAPTEQWCEELGLEYLWHGCHVTMQVGSREYTMGLRHKFRGESSLNTTNVHRTMHTTWKPADIQVLGHLHFNDLQKRSLGGFDCVWIRCGTYLQWCDHAQYSGGWVGQWGLPLVVLYPNEKRIIPFWGQDFAVGLRFLASEREHYRKRLAH